MDAPDGALDPREEPLDVAAWFAAIGRLAGDLGDTQAAGHPRVVRRAFHLSRLAPDPLWAVFASPLSDEEFERELELAGADGAAAGFLNRNLELQIIERDGQRLAEVRSPALGASGQSVALSYALGVVGAWISCIFAAAQLVTEPDSSVIPARHISQSGQLPKSSRH
jgi:hypothetical protein